MATIGSLTSIREKGWERFRALPWPTRTDEEWRRTDPASVPSIPMEPAAGTFQVGWDPPPAEAIRSGVILTDLETALDRFPELVEEYLFLSGEPEGLAKWVALHQACWKGGLLCYVPDGVRVEIPLKAWGQGDGAGNGAALFPHTLVVVGEGSEVTLIEERRPPHSPTLSDEMVEIFLKEAATLRYIRLQRWAPPTTELLTQRTLLAKEARLLQMTVGLGGRMAKANLETILQGPGARAELLGLFLGADKQHFDLHTLQDHQAKATFSDLLYKSALRDEAELIYTGLIRIRKEASKSDAYQANRNLLLSQGAKADSIPMLEIETDDVRCTHGVAVGPVDEEQAFYLMSRGIPPGEAEELIVEGFLEQVLERIPAESVREELRETLKGSDPSGDDPHG